MKPPRGTRDFGPSAMALRRRLEDRMRRILHTFNFREVQTPTFEELELFLAKSGQGVIKELYTFKDKGGRDLCLRPELTAPVMRFYFSDLKAEPKPLRLFYFGPCFRYDEPQAGRYREFWQLGTEIIGDDSPEAHAELLWLGLKLLREAGLERIVLRIGHLGILRPFVSEVLGVPASEQAALMRALDKRDLDGAEGMLGEDGRKKREALERLVDASTWPALNAVGLPASAQAARDHLRAVWDRLLGFGAAVDALRLDPGIARGLEYYTGLVFELDCPDLGAQRQLLGGGEYDLSGVFQGPATPTVGFGLGFDRTLVALERTAKTPTVEERVEVFVAALSAAAVPTAQGLANRLRDLDLRVDPDLSGRGPKKALQRASTGKARVAVLIGDRELERGVVAIKNLDTGEQVEARAEEVTPRIEAWLRSLEAPASRNL